MGRNSHTREMAVNVVFYPELELSGIFDAGGYRTPAVIFGVDRYFYFIITCVEMVAWYKYIVQNDK